MPKKKTSTAAGWKAEQEAKSLHAITFPADYKGPVQRDIVLPGQVVVRFNRLQVDVAAKDYPRAEVDLTPREAREYRAAGLAVKTIAKRTTSTDNPLAAPPAPEPNEEG